VKHPTVSLCFDPTKQAAPNPPRFPAEDLTQPCSFCDPFGILQGYFLILYVLRGFVAPRWQRWGCGWLRRGMFSSPPSRGAPMDPPVAAAPSSSLPSTPAPVRLYLG